MNVAAAVDRGQAQQTQRGGSSLLDTLGRFLGLGGDRGGAGRPQLPSAIVFRINPSDFSREVLSHIEAEAKYDISKLQSLGKQVPSELTDLITQLSLEVETYKTISSIMSRPFLSRESLFIDPKQARVETESRIMRLAVMAIVIFENYISKVSIDVENALQMIARGEVDDNVLRKLQKIPETFRVLLTLLSAVLNAVQKIRLVLYLNMPAEYRSPVINILTGFEIVREVK